MFPVQWVKARAPVRPLTPKSLLRMSFNPQHDGTHKFSRTKRISSLQQSNTLQELLPKLHHVHALWHPSVLWSTLLILSLAIVDHTVFTLKLDALFKY